MQDSDLSLPQTSTFRGDPVLVLAAQGIEEYCETSAQQAARQAACITGLIASYVV
ncbi:hypothetical protein JK215_15360 [Tatumella sp. JGM100]|uniref:hypothetical protein n=1 Tax=unclassified Tatumella TaxID=2649542 RepID=UPI001BB052FD|nr:MULTISPECIES: hypothetical protein [unclassified Tatumella]MBS0878532.1 hypothetical protein [Tatumella sp. JGM82]MBS0892124.1 hypothetical protein [Tatumella sp. JGM94]MBS0903223.1 hypothetical protein [Tatumella sp. JGM100]MBS0857165.1 hypothetical protein [Tatumella sp. JGM16]MBS0913918.1 hypothetical protein [Tatumella sp. JGM91]